MGDNHAIQYRAQSSHPSFLKYCNIWVVTNVEETKQVVKTDNRKACEFILERVFLLGAVTGILHKKTVAGGFVGVIVANDQRKDGI